MDAVQGLSSKSIPTRERLIFALDAPDAFRRGADCIVVGRPIRQAPDPAAAARDIQRRIAALFG